MATTLIQFTDLSGRRRGLRLGRLHPNELEKVRFRVRRLISFYLSGEIIFDKEMREWIKGLTPYVLKKLVGVALIQDVQ